MEEFFTKVLNYSIKKCEKLLPLLIDFDLKHCIKTETYKNSITRRRIDFGRIKLKLGRTNSELKNQRLDLPHRLSSLDLVMGEL
jgi:hypothetical protein